MARYTGPVCRLCRRQGMKLFLKGERCFTPKCAVERRPTPPGASPSDRRRRKESEFSVQLKEKQKARHIYGVLERQFHKHFVSAEHQPGVTGENLLRVLEMRLDNVVYRLGFADSRRQARQLVLHGHVTLNGRRTNIASAQVKAGDTVAVHPSSRRQRILQDRFRNPDAQDRPTLARARPERVERRVSAIGPRVRTSISISTRRSSSSTTRASARFLPRREVAELLEQLNAQVEILQQTEDYANFQVDPLERGFGLTLGNALRRVLLSSLAGAAVTAVRIERIYHEFATIPGRQGRHHRAAPEPEAASAQVAHGPAVTLRLMPRARASSPPPI